MERVNELEIESNKRMRKRMTEEENTKKNEED